MTNPSVNRCLDDNAFDHIDHALGRPTFPLRESYRNYFATDVRSNLSIAFDASPFWELRNVTPCAMAYYSVTEHGRQALADHLAAEPAPWRAFSVTFGGFTSIVPERSRGKARYAAYLRISDCFADLTFGAFAKAATVRVAA